MQYKKDEENDEDFGFEDTTKYGEFISSYFGWTTLKKQKQRVDELENISKQNKRK